MSPGVDSRASSDALMDTASSTLALVQRFLTVLSSSEVAENGNIPGNSPDPLDVLHTSATLLKAHTTKLSLLMINKPFTPSAIRTVVSDISNTCIPGMMSAVEICSPAVYGQLLHREVKLRVRRVFKELEAFMKEIVQLCSAGGSDDAAKGTSRDSLASTGVVWEACDALIELQQLGLPGLAIKKAREFQDLLKDAISELKEWSEDEVDEEDMSEEEDDEDFDAEDVDELTKMFGKMKQLPKSRTDLRATLDKSIQKLRMLSQLYKEVINKRFKGLPAERGPKAQSARISRLDQIMERLRKIPPQTDELASSFYELNNDSALKRLDEILKLGGEAGKISRKDWQDADDDFTIWSDKWVQLVQLA